MGVQSSKFDKSKTSSYLRQTISRINLHRGKKINSIAKKKDDICKHLESGNEVNARIWCETLLNEEAQLPCYDIIAIMCDQVNGRLTQIEKFGPPKDMEMTFHTLIHVAPKLDVDELSMVRQSLGAVMGKPFVKQSDEDKSCIHKTIAENIDIFQPEEGQIIKRLVELAQERNINFTPSHESVVQLNDYCDRRGIPNPLNKGKVTVKPHLISEMPIYNPQPDPHMSFPPPPGGGNNHISVGGGTNYSYMPPGADMQHPPTQNYLPPPTMQQPPQNMYPDMSNPPPTSQFNNPYQQVNGGSGQEGAGGPQYSLYQDTSSINTNTNITQPENNSSNDMGGNGASSFDDLEARLNALKKF